MIRIPLIALALSLLVLVTPLPSAHGQVLLTSTPISAVVSPTASPAPLPSGPALLKLMRKAVIARRTVRVGVTSQSTWTGHWVLGVTWMDLDLQSNAVRELDTIQRVQPNASRLGVAIERRELVLAGGMSANRKPSGPWTCERVPGVRVRDTLVPFQMTAANVKNLGPEKAAGVTSWHVQATGAEVPAWSTRSATVDLDISQSDDTLIRLSLTAVTRLGGMREHETVTESYRRYGKAVTVTVPSQCRSPSASVNRSSMAASIPL